MISLLGLLVCRLSCFAPAPGRAAAPAALIIATARGEATVPVRLEHGHPALPAPDLSALLPIATDLRPDWAEVRFAGQPFEFLLGAPAFVFRDRVMPLAGGAYLDRDTLFLPLQWLTEHIPALFHEGYRYDPLAGRFEEASVTPVVTRVTPARPAPVVRRAAPLLPAGVLRFPHTVVVDAGHGGPDPGNPGLHLPGRLREKDVTLAIARQLKKALETRGIAVVTTRTTDTLIDLRDRGRYCRDECDLFLSIHVNSLPRRPGYEDVSGFETYFLAAARTDDDRRVAAMENDALRYEAGGAVGEAIEFILKDLQVNEHLRESALLADLIQADAGKIHPGGSRGVSQAGFVVLTTARRPAVLIETGFSTNRGDGKFLASAAGQQRIADAIAGAVVRYLQRYETKIAGEVEP